MNKHKWWKRTNGRRAHIHSERQEKKNFFNAIFFERAQKRRSRRRGSWRMKRKCGAIIILLLKANIRLGSHSRWFMHFIWNLYYIVATVRRGPISLHKRMFWENIFKSKWVLHLSNMHFRKTHSSAPMLQSMFEMHPTEPGVSWCMRVRAMWHKIHRLFVHWRWEVHSWHSLIHAINRMQHGNIVINASLVSDRWMMSMPYQTVPYRAMPTMPYQTYVNIEILLNKLCWILHLWKFHNKHFISSSSHHHHQRRRHRHYHLCAPRCTKISNGKHFFLLLLFQFQFFFFAINFAPFLMAAPFQIFINVNLDQIFVQVFGLWSEPYRAESVCLF